MHCNIIYNPNSGKGTFKNHLDRVTQTLESLGYTWNIFATTGPKHATQLMHENADVDLVLVSGGDGTINEVLQAVPQLKTVPFIAYIPSGTANDFGKTIGLSKNIQKNLALLKAPVVRNKDIASSNQGIFNYIAAIGNYVDISYNTTKKMKRIWGFLAYIFFGIKAFFTAPIIKAKVTTDTQTFEGRYSLILVVNSESVGGFKIFKNPALDDGLFDVVLMPYVPFLNNIYFLFVFIFKRMRVPGLIHLKTASVHVETTHDRPWSLDGEIAASGDLNAQIMTQKIPFVIHPRKVHLFHEK